MLFKVVIVKCFCHWLNLVTVNLANLCQNHHVNRAWTLVPMDISSICLDVILAAEAGTDPGDHREHNRVGGDALSETWKSRKGKMLAHVTSGGHLRSAEISHSFKSLEDFLCQHYYIVVFPLKRRIFTYQCVPLQHYNQEKIKGIFPPAVNTNRQDEVKFLILLLQVILKHTLLETRKWTYRNV